MKVKLFVALTVVGAVLALYSVFLPWLSFTGGLETCSTELLRFQVAHTGSELARSTEQAPKSLYGRGNTGLPLQVTFGSGGCLLPGAF